MAFNPPVYYCQRASEPLTLDGDLDKGFWANASWTRDFQDIEGDIRPVPRFRTRAKMLWDDDALYVGAELSGPEIWATVTQRDEVIFVDNDFEIFIDPDSDTHNYFEFEMNALNTVWDLLLTKPYRDQGKPITGFDLKGLRSAVKIYGGLNDPSSVKWTVEVVLPLASFRELTNGGGKPQAGDYWRVNFSRVQWPVDFTEDGYRKRTAPTGKPLPEDNWVWAPTGVIDIHRAEYWGFLFFVEHADARPAIPNAERIKWKLREAYYSLHDARKRTGRFPSAGDMIGLPEGVSAQTTDNTFELVCMTDAGDMVTMREDGLVSVR